MNYFKKMKMKSITFKTSLLLLLVVSTFNLQAQEDDFLPKGLTETERALLPQFQFTSNRVMSDPPTGPVRAAAEWEEVKYFASNY